MDEQASIVHYLDHADELINRYISAKERLIALLEEHRQAVIHQAVTRGLDPNVKPSKPSRRCVARTTRQSTGRLPELKQPMQTSFTREVHRPAHGEKTRSVVQRNIPFHAYSVDGSLTANGIYVRRTHNLTIRHVDATRSCTQKHYSSRLTLLLDDHQAAATLQTCRNRCQLFDADMPPRFSIVNFVAKLRPARICMISCTPCSVP